MKHRNWKKKKDATKRIAEERIEILLSLAEQTFKTDPEQSKRYIILAEAIGMRQNIRLNREQKRKYCKQCHTFRVPGKNCHIRLKNSVILTTCHVCGGMSRYPYYEKQNEIGANNEKFDKEMTRSNSKYEKGARHPK
ncbi:MAG: ribonuclease P protein component 4 [Methanimicrococcus sp.]|nr:ribonuclease P protein component 4 [Methanimicrococcus sp.]